MAKTSGGVRAWNMTANQGSVLRGPTIEQQVEQNITKVYDDFETYGYSRMQPFYIAKVEKRMQDFAKAHNIPIAGDEIYMSAERLGHGRRTSKVAKGIAATKQEMITFPKRMKSMRLYHDKKGDRFVYRDGRIKYVIDPNYEIKISRKKTKKAVFITATTTNGKEFLLPDFTEIK